MERIEELVRDSLEARAQDVEPTPALWQEVDRRVARRRRVQVLTWALAGATSIAVVVLALPAVIGALSPPPAPEIMPADEAPAPAGATVPTHAAVAAADGEVRLLELGTGASRPVGGTEGETVVDLTVGPTTSPDADGSGVVVATTSADNPRVVLWRLPDRGEVWAPEPAFETSAAVSGDGDHLALLRPADADGAIVTVYLAALGDEDLETADVAELAVIEAGSRLLDWIGPAAEPGDVSALWLQRPDGTVVALRVTVDAADGLVAGDTTPLFDGAAVLGAAAGGIIPDGPLYLLRQGADGLELVWSPDGDMTSTTTVALDDLLDDAEPEGLWVDAAFDAVLVGDGSRALLLTHDGAGVFGAPAQLEGDVARAALLPATAGAVTPADPEEEPVDDPVLDDPSPSPAVAEPVLVADGRNLDLLDAGGRRRIVELPVEGESNFVDVAVRPGSTVDDLTVLLLTQAEGMYDVRHLRVVDGDVATFEVLDAPYGPGGAPANGPADHLPPTPVWAPDGDGYAWIDTTPNGAALRTVGWEDGPGTGDPATDQTSFPLEGVPDEGVSVQDWVVGGEDELFELRLIAGGDSGGLYVLRGERRADGALALPYGSTPTRSSSGDPTELVFAVAGATPQASVAWAYVLDGEGEQRLVHAPYTEPSVLELPPEATFDDGIPLPRLRATPSGDAVLRGDGEAFLVSVDGEVTPLGRATAVEPVG